jgi:hypothetical protein
MARIEAELLAQANGLIATGTSAANAAQTVTIAAPGAGKRNHLTGVVVIYSDASDHAITMTVNAVAVVMNTGTGVNGLVFTGVDLQGAANATITIDAVAGGATVTSTISAFYYVEAGD